MSKFDRHALELFGFETFKEAYNTLGYGLGARPASIKNYRDEFDPFFPNPRQGWKSRPLRDHCKNILERFGGHDIESLALLVKSFLVPSEQIAAVPELASLLRRMEEGEESSFAKRIATGLAAENWFRRHWRSINRFSDITSITDTTSWGCGFDFKLDPPAPSRFHAVEVKGLRDNTGQIQLTELEHETAAVLGDRYSLVVVRNFAESPDPAVFPDPLRCGIPFDQVTRTETRVSWTAKIG